MTTLQQGDGAALHSRLHGGRALMPADLQGSGRGCCVGPVAASWERPEWPPGAPSGQGPARQQASRQRHSA